MDWVIRIRYSYSRDWSRFHSNPVPVSSSRPKIERPPTRLSSDIDRQSLPWGRDVLRHTTWKVDSYYSCFLRRFPLSPKSDVTTPLFIAIVDQQSFVDMHILATTGNVLFRLRRLAPIDWLWLRNWNIERDHWFPNRRSQIELTVERWVPVNNVANLWTSSVAFRSRRIAITSPVDYEFV